MTSGSHLPPAGLRCASFFFSSLSFFSFVTDFLQYLKLEGEKNSTLQTLCYSLIEGLLIPFYQLLASDDEGLSSSVVEFSQTILSIVGAPLFFLQVSLLAHPVVVCLFVCLFVQFKQEKKAKGTLSGEKRKALQNLLSVVVLKMKYPATYNFQRSGDDEQVFDETRAV